MTRALGKLKQTLSVLLAAAMIVTALPQTTAAAYALEAQSALDESSGAAENSAENNDEGNSGNGGVNTGKENGSEETGTSDENDSEDANISDGNDSEGMQTPDENSPENTENPDENGSEDVGITDENGAGDTESMDENDSEDIADSDETDLEDTEKITGIEQSMGVSDNSVSGNDVPDSSVSDNDVSGEEKDEPATVRILVPTYQYNSKTLRSFIKELQYKAGESEEWTSCKVRTTVRPGRDDYIDITVDAGATLQFRIVPIDHTVINEVSYLQGGADSVVLEAENDIYKIENIQPQSWTPAYRVNISADFVYTLHFADVYADDHSSQRSVKLYQYTPGSADSDTGEDTGDSGVTYKDVIGETVELSGSEMQQYFADHYYKIEAEEGYTFYSIDSNSTGVRILRDAANCYTISGGYNLGVQDITVFVLAEPTKTHQLKFHIPSEMKNKFVMSITGTDPAGNSKELELTNDSVEVADDLAVTVRAWLEDDLNHTVRAVCKVGDEDAVELPYDSREKKKNFDDVPYAWEQTYSLGSMLRDGDVTIDFSQIDMYSVALHAQEYGEQIRTIYIYEPINTRYWYSDGEYENLTVDVAEGETLKFNVSEGWLEGTLHISTSEDGSGKIIPKWDRELEEEVYTLSPAGPMDIYFTVTGYERRFNYSESDFTVLVYDYDADQGVDGTEEPLQLSDDRIYTSFRDPVQFRIMVKPNNDKREHVTVSYINRWDEWQEADRKPEYDDTENGYLCYVTGYVYGSSEIKIEGYNTNTVTFAKNNDSIYFQRGYKEEWGDDYYYWSDIEETYDQLNAGIEVKEGEEVCFRVRGYDSGLYRLKVDFTSTGNDTLRAVLNGDGEVGYYYFTPTADATVTAEITERKQHTVTIEKADSITDFKVWGGTREEGESGLTGKYLVQDGDTIEIRGISNDESGGLLPGYRGKVLCMADGKTSEVQMTYVYGGRNDDNTVNWIQCFELEVTGDITLNVDAVQTSECTMTFADPDELMEVRVWEWGKSADEDNLYDAQTHSAVLKDDQIYLFDFMLKDGNAVESVIMKDAEGGERQLWVEEDEIKTYQLGVPQSDVQIKVNTVPGYTILFAAEQDSDLEYWIDFDEYAVDITNEKIQVAATEGFPFSWDGNEDEYELSLDSDAFVIKKVWMSYGYDEDEGWYQYSIEPVRTEQLPATVTVTGRAYPEHTITMDYTAQVKQIYLENASGSSIWNRGEDKEVQVQGKGIILGARTINGYMPEVKIQGSGEAEILTPFRVNDYEVSEYYIGEITEDVTISVTAVRSTQKQTYYEVGFLSGGNKVRIADAVAQTTYSVAGNDEDYWYADKYLVQKGSSITFTVEASAGYEVDGVYANDEEMVPVQGVYTVTPVKDTQIRVDVSRIEQKYPVTFTYPDTVAGVKVKDLALQDNTLQVKEGTQISFTVELADQNHSVTSVKMNGKEIPFDQANGCYTMITIAAAMQVEIATAEADKRVTFTKTVEHMDYSVETGEMVKESETAGTYIVAALAGVLRFTVTSSKIESVPEVTYISATQGKVSLQAKSRQEAESAVSYTYEVAVSELPVKSEITIGETNVAGKEDKDRLQEALNSYKDKYNQADYTAESWEVFAEALADAQACLDKEDATMAEVDAAIAALGKAAAGLKKAEENPDPPTPVTKEGLWIEEIPNQTYTGSAFKPEINVYNGEELLTNKKDYTISYKNNINAGTAIVTVNGKGNYKAKDTATFNILKKNLNDADITVDDVYAIIKANGTTANPKVTVKYGKKTLKNGTDYTVEYPVLLKDADGKVVPGTYEIKINAKKANGDDALNYTGSRMIKYEVRKNGTLLMSKAKVVLEKTKVEYKNNNQGAYGQGTEKPIVKSVSIGNETLTEGFDYEVSYENWDKIGKATVTVTAKDGTIYYGSKSVTYTVEGTKLTAKNLEITGINPAGYVYTGKPIYVSGNTEDGSKGDMVVKTKGDGAKELTEGTDYTVSYKTGKKEGEHTNVGTVTVTIAGINAYTGSVKKTFKITAFDLADYHKNAGAAGLQFNTGTEAEAKYTKAGAKPAFTLTFNNGETVRKLMEKTDYTVSYSGNTKVKAGEQSATMTIKGKGNFKGKILYTYEVTGASAEDVAAAAADIVMPTQFKKLKTTVKIVENSSGKELKAGTDYEKAFTYYSDAACTTLITADNFSSLQVNDTVYIKVIMKGNYVGAGSTPSQLTASFKLYDAAKKIADGKKYAVKVETGKTAAGENIACDQKGNPIYTSKEIRPQVVVTPKNSNVPLREGEDYVVTYSNNINKGKATATITGIGQYGGTKSVKFAIVSADMTWVKQAQKAAERALEIFSDLMLIPD